MKERLTFLERATNVGRSETMRYCLKRTSDVRRTLYERWTFYGRSTNVGRSTTVLRTWDVRRTSDVQKQWSAELCISCFARFLFGSLKIAVNFLCFLATRVGGKEDVEIEQVEDDEIDEGRMQ